MWQSEHEAQLRQQIFLFAIGIFLFVYLISLYRFRSFEWAMLTSSVAFGVTVVGGAVLAAIVKLQDDEPDGEIDTTGANAPGVSSATSGNVVDFRSNDYDSDRYQDAQAAD